MLYLKKNSQEYSSQSDNSNISWNLLTAIAEAITDMRHVKDKENVVADALSWLDDISGSIIKAPHISRENSIPGLFSLPMPTANPRS